MAGKRVSEFFIKGSLPRLRRKSASGLGGFVLLLWSGVSTLATE